MTSYPQTPPTVRVTITGVDRSDEVQARTVAAFPTPIAKTSSLMVSGNLTMTISGAGV